MSTRICTYAETHALDANSFLITTRYASTFGSGNFHTTVTVNMEYVIFGLINKWITDGSTSPEGLDCVHLGEYLRQGDALSDSQSTAQPNREPNGEPSPSRPL